MRSQIGVEGRSLAEVHSSVGTSGVSVWRRLFAFGGPAYLVAVGYMDPGNWATDLAGGYGVPANQPVATKVGALSKAQLNAFIEENL